MGLVGRNRLLVTNGPQTTRTGFNRTDTRRGETHNSVNGQCTSRAPKTPGDPSSLVERRFHEGRADDRGRGKELTAMSVKCPVSKAKVLIERRFWDPIVREDMKRWSFVVAGATGTSR